MSDAIGNIDLGALEQTLAPLYEQFGQTPPPAVPGTQGPTPEELQQQFDAFYDYRNSLLIPAAGGGDEGDDEGGETAEEKATRLANEREDARDLASSQKRQQDARSTINTVLASYGLEGLSDFVYTEIIQKETVNINNPDAIIFE